MRQTVGLSQSELGHELGVTLTTVQRWESGRRTPRRQTLRQLEFWLRQRRIQEPLLGHESLVRALLDAGLLRRKADTTATG